MKKSITEQWNQLEEMVMEFNKASEILIRAAQKIDPSIKTRTQALALVEKLNKEKEKEKP